MVKKVNVRFDLRLSNTRKLRNGIKKNLQIVEYF